MVISLLLRRTGQATLKSHVRTSGRTPPLRGAPPVETFNVHLILVEIPVHALDRGGLTPPDITLCLPGC
jgi:hypothetical protein